MAQPENKPPIRAIVEQNTVVKYINIKPVKPVNDTDESYQALSLEDENYVKELMYTALNTRTNTELELPRRCGSTTMSWRIGKQLCESKPGTTISYIYGEDYSVGLLWKYFLSKQCSDVKYGDVDNVDRVLHFSNGSKLMFLATNHSTAYDIERVKGNSPDEIVVVDNCTMLLTEIKPILTIKTVDHNLHTTRTKVYISKKV